MDRELDPRSTERERDLPRGGSATHDERRSATPVDERDVFSRDLELPRGPKRERIVVRGREYRLRGSEVRTLSVVGAFRVVAADEQRQPADGRSVLSKDLENLKDLGLARTAPYILGHQRTTLVTLTEAGRGVLEASRSARSGEAPQTFYAGVAKPRELAHDMRVHQAYREAAEGIAAEGGRIRRVILEEELKREYQIFLQAPNKGRQASDGRPQRDPLEIARWAEDHRLPIVDGHVRFPDIRIEHETGDGRLDVRDVEVTTPHYRGAHAAAKVAAGFVRYRAVGARLSGSRGEARGGRYTEAHLAEEMLR